MKYQNHLFISYTHGDNQPLMPGDEGWVTRFHAYLASFLATKIPQKQAVIWRDVKLNGNDVFGDEILDQFPKTAMMVSVLTPSYVESEWCTRELEEFCRIADGSEGLRVGNQMRVLKVVRVPDYDEAKLPAPVQETLGYPFFTVVDDRPYELDPTDTKDVQALYKRQMNALAVDIAAMLKELDVADGAAVDARPDKGTVYLAESSYDQRDARDSVRSALRSHGYRVLPETELPRGYDDYVAEVERLLAMSDLSVHIVGRGHGAVPDGPGERSVVALQNELAVERAKTAGLERLIWVSDDARAAQGMQKAFVESLLNDAEAQFGADLITADLQTLKGVMHGMLEDRGARAKPAASEVADEGRLVYLICDERDRSETIPLRKYLKEQGFTVQIPAFEGAASEVRKANQGILSECDAIVVYYGEGDEAWKRTLDSELGKIAGYRSKRPLPTLWTYLAGPRTTDKEELLAFEAPRLIEGLGGFVPESVGELIASLATGDGV